jgi:PadR family transcriptional regulator PadR
MAPRDTRKSPPGRTPEQARAQLYKGLAELALLRLLQDASLYGLEILDRIRDEAGIDIASGTLYPLLHRLERQGLIASDWQLVDAASHPRKYYALTAAGRRELSIHLADWRALSARFHAFLDGRST